MNHRTPRRKRRFDDEDDYDDMNDRDSDRRHKKTPRRRPKSDDPGFAYGTEDDTNNDTTWHPRKERT